MIQRFVDRESELDFLEKSYFKNTAQFIILYGRRRIGKTELIKKFIENKKAVYILCTRDSLQENVNEVKRKICELTGKEYFLKLDTNSFFDLFKYLVDEIRDEKVIVVLDEFPYLIELQRGIVSTFQKIWDELLKGRRIFLLLCGSSIGMMETEVLGYKSPLYGRRTGEWNVEPFNFKNIRNMFKKFPIEEVAKIYFIFGGTPFYLAQIDSSLTVEQNVKKKILTKGEILYSEPKFLLKEEFREPKTYMLILKYLSLGYNTQGELSSATGIEKGNLSKYLSVLEETRLINFVLPLGQRKRGIYLISDPFFNFWFRFVYPNLTDLEIGLVDEVFSKINSQINSYYGLMFEQLVFELVKNKAVPIDVPYNETRKWWYKDKEIDVIALNGKTNKIIFIECKWQDDVDAEKILEELKEKATYVKWNKGGREEYFAIFAKSFRKKVREPNLKLFDLRSLETSLGKSFRSHS